MKNRLLFTLVLFFVSYLCQAQNPILWGFTREGGQNNDGIIFNYIVSPGTETDKYDFVGMPDDGRTPISTLIKANNGLLYGLTQIGGINHNAGTIFSYNISTGIETDLYDFGSGTDGADPRGLLIQASDSLLYGMTQDGGVYGDGILFRYNISTGAETDLHDFGSGTDGAVPLGSLVQASNGLLYGVVGNGGFYDGGIIFSYNISNSSYTDVHDFGTGTDGTAPEGSLVQASDSLLYGMTGDGGINNNGTIFSYNISTGTETDLHDFGGGTDGKDPWYGKLLQVNDSLFYGMTSAGGTNDAAHGGYGIIFSYNISTGTETDVHDFGGGTDGKFPSASLIQASNGLLYGMTSAGGVNSEGIIFSYNIISTAETDLHDFGSGIDGTSPWGSFIEVDTATISVAPVATICTGGSIILTASGASSYTWAPAKGLSATTGDSVIANPTATTIYTVTGTGGIPTYPTTVTVRVIPYPSVTVNTPSPVCSGTGVTLTGNGAASYTWSPSSNLSSTIGSTVTATPTATTTYTIIGGNGGCTDTATTVVTINPNPTITASPNPISFCHGGSSVLTASGGNTYSWSPSTNLSSTTGTSVTANPVVTTTYTVTGTNSNGCSATNTVTVTVNPNPAITASPNPVSYCPGGSSILTASGGITYTWSPSTSLSDTIGSSVMANPTVTTIYTIIGTNSNGCSATNTVTITVNPNPTITVTPSPTSYCYGGSSTLTASGGNTYTWSPSTNLSATTGTNVTANPLVTTTYTVTGTNSNGCSATNTVTITVNPNPTITVTPSPASYCYGGSSTFTVSGGNTYTWSPSTSLSATTGTNITANPVVTTTYTVTGTNLNGCSGTNTVTITVNPNPTITASPSPASYCFGGSSTLTASGGNTYTWLPSTNLNATTGTYITANPTITTTYTITGINSNGCSATNTVTVTVNPNPTITAIPSPTSYCYGGSSIFTASGGNSYTWSPSTNLSSTIGSMVTASPTITTTYTVIGTNGSECVDTTTTIITVNPNPVIKVPTPPTICNGSIATLKATGANSYSWSPATGLSNITGDSIIANPTATTTYTVAGINGNGCTDSTTVTVTVSPILILTVDTPQPKCSGNKDTLIATGANNYTWSPSTGLSATSGSIVLANPAITTTYTISGMSLSGCSGTTMVTVAINPNPSLIVNEPFSICNGEHITLTASGGTSYTWLPSTGLSATSGSSVVANPTATSVYVVTAYSNGCTSTLTDTVKLIPASPLANKPKDTSICNGQSVTLIAPVSGSGYSWNPSLTLSSSTGDSVLATPTVTTTYTVTGKDSLGCTALGLDTVNILQGLIKPKITRNGNVLTSSATEGNQWYRNDTIIPGADNQKDTATAVGCYSVIATNLANGCNSISDTVCVISIESGINQLSVDDNQLSMYPNPTSNQLTIINNKMSIQRIEIDNVLGETMLIYISQFNKVGTYINLDVSPLEDGMYFVRITSANETTTRKIIVCR